MAIALASVHPEGCGAGPVAVVASPPFVPCGPWLPRIPGVVDSAHFHRAAKSSEPGEQLEQTGTKSGPGGLPGRATLETQPAVEHSTEWTKRHPPIPWSGTRRSMRILKQVKSLDLSANTLPAFLVFLTFSTTLIFSTKKTVSNFSTADGSGPAPNRRGLPPPSAPLLR